MVGALGRHVQQVGVGERQLPQDCRRHAVAFDGRMERPARPRASVRRERIHADHARVRDQQLVRGLLEPGVLAIGFSQRRWTISTRMAISEAEQPIEGGTVGWVATMARRAMGALLLPVATILLFASPAFYLVSAFYPLADPFMWLAAFGAAVVLARQFITSGYEEPADTDSFTRVQLFGYLAVLFILGASMFSTLIGSLGVLAAVVATTTGSAVLGIAIGLAGPAVDIWIGHRLGVSLTVVGLVGGALVLRGIEWIGGASSETTATARRDARRLI